MNYICSNGIYRCCTTIPPCDAPAPFIFSCSQPVPELEKYMESIVAKTSKIDSSTSAIEEQVQDSPKREEFKSQIHNRMHTMNDAF